LDRAAVRRHAPRGGSRRGGGGAAHHGGGRRPRQHPAGAPRLPGNRSAGPAGALSRRPRLGILGLERHLAGSGVPRLGYPRLPAAHPLPAAGAARRGRRIRDARADPRHPPAGAADAPARDPRLRPCAAQGSTRHGHRGRRRFRRRPEQDRLSPRGRPTITRRQTMHHALTRALAAGMLALAAGGASAADKIKVGFMLPYSGTYAALGAAIENGFKLYVVEQGGKLGGREIEYFKVDDESNPAKASENANRLIKRDQVDVLIGTVHSGVAMALAKAAKGSDTTLIVTNAGADASTGPTRAPGSVPRS